MDFGQTLDALAYLQHLAGRSAEAKKYVEEVDRRLGPTAATAHNNFAWLLAMMPKVRPADAVWAVELANKAVAQRPKDGSFWNTLGVAYYRAENWKEAIRALEKSNECFEGKLLSFNGFFLGMAHCQLGDRAEARILYDRAAQWMQTHQPGNHDLRRFQAEAAALLQIDEPAVPTRRLK
jgi:Flp pilus assembly protein TadD